MSTFYRADAPKKPANLSINSDLLAKSRALRINLSAVLEEGLRAELAKAENGRWRASNAMSIRAYNDHVERDGCFGDDERAF